MEKDTKCKIYELGSKLGLNKNEINIIMNEQNIFSEKSSFSNGPNWYSGGRYGTISINEF